MKPGELLTGEYAAFLSDKNELVGGCIYWNIDEKNDKVVWTSDWWLFKDIRKVKVDFYNIKEDKLELIVQKKGKLDISHNIVLGKENKGTIRILI